MPGSWRIVRVFAFVLMLAGHVLAQEVEKVAPELDSDAGVSSRAPDSDVPKIHIPVLPVLVEPEEIDDTPEPPKPKPDRGPVPVTSLSEDTWYVVESNIPLIVLHSPSGHVSVQPDQGPIKVRGKFVDGTGKTETRTFNSKHLYFINAIKAGKIELLIVPQGVQEEKDVIRQPLTVMGVAPIPPPEPPPGPGPTPPGPMPPEPDPGPTPGPVTSFHVIFVKESATTLNAEQSSIPAAKVLRDYLNLKTTPEGGLTGWREYDPHQNTANEQPTMKALWTKVKPSLQRFPCMVVEVNGDAKVMPFPANVTEALSVLKKAAGE